MKKVCVLLLLTFLFVNIALAQEKGYGKYTGKIGPFAITLFMRIAGSVEGDAVGYYYYNARPENKFTLVLVKFEAINAHGTMNVVLDEYSPKGNHTGTFDGNLEGRGGGYDGTFTNGKDEKFAFKLIGEN